MDRISTSTPPGGQQWTRLPEPDPLPPPAELPLASRLPVLPPMRSALYRSQIEHAAVGSTPQVRPPASSIPPVVSANTRPFPKDSIAPDAKVPPSPSDPAMLAAHPSAAPVRSPSGGPPLAVPAPLPAQSTHPAPVAPKKATVFQLLKERYRGDKNRNRILDVIQLYLHQNNKTMAINETPLIENKIIDLSTLFLAVAGQGGFAKVDPLNGWTELAFKMKYNTPETAGAILRDVYTKIFLSFELQLSSKKAQAQQASEQASKNAPANAAPVSTTPKPGAAPASTVAGAAPPGQMSRDLGKLSKKRDRQQYQMDGTGGGEDVSTASASSTAADKLLENPSFSFNRNSSDKVLMADCVKDLCSNNGAAVVRGLNTLTLRTAEIEARGLSLEPYPSVILALGELLDVVNPIVASYFEKALIDQNYNAFQRDRFGLDWNIQPNVHSVECLDDNAVLLSCLNILRNISFEVVNEALLAHSSKIVTHVAFLLMAPVLPGRLMPECVAYAFDILTNIGKTMDLSGRKRKFHKESWMLDSIEEDDREALRARCTPHFSIQSSDVYAVAAHSLFPRLVYFMESTNRDYVLKAIDCFAHLVQAEENVELLSNCPSTLPSLLIELLCVSITTAETALPSNLRNTDTDELSARPEPMIGLFADQTDVSIRDATLYAIYMLVCLSSSWRKLVPTLPRALDTLRKIATALPRTDSSSRAQQILAVMTVDTSNKTEYLRMQREMCVAACGDEVISDIIFAATANNFYTNDSAKVNSAGASASISVIPRIRWG